MYIARQHLLSGARLAGDQHRGVRRRDLLGELDHMRHGLVAIDQLARVVAHRGEHRCDQLRVGRQRDILLGAGMDGGDGGAGVVAGPAGDDRHGDALGFEAEHEIADVERDIDHQQVGAAAGAQHRERLLDRFGMGDAGALLHRELGRGGELTLERSDDQEAHGDVLLCMRATRWLLCFVMPGQ